VLRTRVISAVILFLLVAVPALLGGIPFFLLIALIAGLGTWEYTRLLRQGNHHPITPQAFLLSLLFVFQAQWPTLLPLGLVLSLAVAGSLLVTLAHPSPAPVTDWALTLAGALYLGILLGTFLQLRAMTSGLGALLLAAACTWAADISAYFAGRAFGRHLWWPRHSPKKTWEGYLTGILGAVLVAGLLGPWLLGVELAEGLGLGLLIGTVAPLGDLAESMLKREVGAKDSSNLIPGHGGVLDRIDSLLISIPLAYLWLTYLP
jgi:phosphatidate cytidylyltransferase